MPPPQTIDRALAGALRTVRLRRKETQEEVAIAAGMTITAYGRVERGHAGPTWSTVRRLAEALDISLEELGQAVEREEG